MSIPTSADRAAAKMKLVREAAESDLEQFIKLLAPQRCLGNVHKELITWWNRSEAKDHQMVLLPRAHQKSAMIAYRVAWEITRNPAVTIMYLSATANLAEKQLKMIKDILTSNTYRKYWPEMVNEQEGKRERWNTWEIAVDHPIRKQEGVRDPTVFTAGLTSGTTGMHCDVAVLDDVVVPENAYTTEGRQRVAEAYSLLSSIENPGAREWVVGTRYHPKDLYDSLRAMVEQTYDADGEVAEEVPVYEVFERVVEDAGDGSGEYLWPLQYRPDGKRFGFDQAILARKKAQYLDQTQFRAQYYNNPNDPDNEPIKREWFQYYDKSHVKTRDGVVYMNGEPLETFAAIDFAFSMKATADYTCIAVIGVSSAGNIYVLDVIRFKTSSISEYYSKIKDAYLKWKFKKIRMEITVAQQVLVRELRDQYFRVDGLPVSIDEYRPSTRISKEERMAAVLRPRYENMSVWHAASSGNMQVLEEELVLLKPPHDDIKDALTNAIEIMKIPSAFMRRSSSNKVVPLRSGSRFGGM